MKLKITVDGKVYEVEVDVAEPEPIQPSYLPPVGTRLPAAPAPSAAPASKPAAAPSGPVADESKVCRSPIAGVVVKVNAQAGQQIQVNDVLIVLEAMKMETVITAPVAGKIKQVHAKVGDGVQGGQVLIELE